MSAGVAVQISSQKLESGSSELITEQMINLHASSA